jgi:hypothetical protein
VLSDEDDELRLLPEAFAELKIKAVQGKKSQSLTLKIRWSSTDSDSQLDDSPLFIEAKKND